MKDKDQFNGHQLYFLWMKNCSNSYNMEQKKPDDQVRLYKYFISATFLQLLLLPFLV